MAYLPDFIPNLPNFENHAGFSLLFLLFFLFGRIKKTAYPQRNLIFDLYLFLILNFSVL